MGVLNDAVEDLPKNFEELPTDLPGAAKDQGESDVEEARERKRSRRRSALDANDRDGMEERRQVVECRGWEDRGVALRTRKPQRGMQDEKIPLFIIAFFAQSSS